MLSLNRQLDHSKLAKDMPVEIECPSCRCELRERSSINPKSNPAQSLLILLDSIEQERHNNQPFLNNYNHQNDVERIVSYENVEPEQPNQ